MLAEVEASLPIRMIRSLPWLYAMVSGLHIIGLATMFGAIAVLDLRVIGWWRPNGWQASLPVVSPIAAAGLALAICTGCLLFAVRPQHYLANPAFILKLALLLAALANVALFHLVLRRWDGLLRITAAMSLVLWAGVILAGRFIAFTSPSG